MRPPFRSRDPGLSIRAFRDPIWVVCPRCQGPARSFRDEAGDRFRLVCRRCPRMAELQLRASPEGVGEDGDGRFGLPLYLTAPVRGHRLWVYNPVHLEALAGWLGASLRERSTSATCRNRTVMSRLPRWMSCAAARPDVMKALSDLRSRALREGLL